MILLLLLLLLYFLFFKELVIYSSISPVAEFVVVVSAVRRAKILVDAPTESKKMRKMVMQSDLIGASNT
jgi:hypothetical protein